MNTNNNQNDQNNTKKTNRFSQFKNGIASVLRFIKHIRLPELFAQLPDKRQQSKTEYSIASLVLWAFSLCFFRQESKNKFHTTLEHLEPCERRGILNLLEIKNNNLPDYTTVDNALKNINYKELNNIFFQLFDQLKKRKFFYNHSELLKYNRFLIGADGHWTHTYGHPHVCDKNGNNTCPYCLPRKRFKGTPKEEIYWVHVLVTFVLIFEDFSLPIYTYALQSNQVDTSQSDNALKQECELKAAHNILRLIKDRFPRINFFFLGDALYGNVPFIKLCKDLDFEYIIVLKDNFKKVRHKCDEFSNLEFYKKSYAFNQKIKSNNKSILKKHAWFNNVEVEENLYTNVLRFQEEFIDENNQSTLEYSGEWICSKKIFKENCLKLAHIGRLRWNHEDVHNTLKNRGFDIKHDMARKNPNLQIFWKIINFISLFVFEIFRHTLIAKKHRKNLSLKQYAIDLLHQLLKFSWDKIRDAPILKKSKIQFRYVFESPP
jgi:hypothetical protein